MKLLIFMMGTLIASSTNAADMPRAYQVISAHYGVPSEVFFSVMMQESGKQTRPHEFLPWPWVLNIDEKGHYYETREEAEIALHNALSDPNATHKVAVGLGQIYMPSHKSKFPNASTALDPNINLNYAAQLIAYHYLWTVEQGNPDWWIAVGRYHTPSNESLASNYRKQVYQRCLKISTRCSLFGRGGES